MIRLLVRVRANTAAIAVRRLRWLRVDPLRRATRINERLIHGHQAKHLHPFGQRPTFKLAQRLRLHPTIYCHFSRPLGEGYNYSSATHGMRLAVARRDMQIPLCPRCMIEDPYE